jgi:hypothetical protein
MMCADASVSAEAAASTASAVGTGTCASFPTAAGSGSRVTWIRAGERDGRQGSARIACGIGVQDSVDLGHRGVDLQRYARRGRDLEARGQGEGTDVGEGAL